MAASGEFITWNMVGQTIKVLYKVMMAAEEGAIAIWEEAVAGTDDEW